MPIYENSIVPPVDPNALTIERIEQGNGIRVYVKGHKYPFKGMPTKEAVDAIAIIKKLLKLQPIKAMWAAIEPFVLKDEFQQPMTREIIKMFPSKLGITIAHTFEFDSAYRLMFQDLLKETTKEKLLNHPLQEIRRLIAISKRRAHPVAFKKIRGTLLAILPMLYLPTIRNRVRACHFPNLQPDSDDAYWTRLRTDYKWNA